MINENILFSSSSFSDENEKVGHKRKRGDENEMSIEKNMSNKKSKINDNHKIEDIKIKKNEDDDISGELFDKNGKLILTNFQF